VLSGSPNTGALSSGGSVFTANSKRRASSGIPIQRNLQTNCAQSCGDRSSIESAYFACDCSTYSPTQIVNGSSADPHRREVDALFAEGAPEGRRVDNTAPAPRQVCVFSHCRAECNKCSASNVSEEFCRGRFRPWNSCLLLCSRLDDAYLLYLKALLLVTAAEHLFRAMRHTHNRLYLLVRRCVVSRGRLSTERRTHGLVCSLHCIHHHRPH
jgi:hypothetical protein